MKTFSPALPTRIFLAVVLLSPLTVLAHVEGGAAGGFLSAIGQAETGPTGTR